MTETKTEIRNWKIPFFSIWTGQAFSLVGSRIVQFALVWWLTELTGSATVLATASIVGLVPEIVLGPIAGAYVDRWNRRIVMIIADGLIALASLWLAFMFWQNTIEIWHIYMLMFIRSIGGSFHWPAMQASTTLMVPRKHLARVAGMNQTMYGMLYIIGAPLGALLIEILPSHSVMLVDVATAVFAITPLLFINIPQPDRDPEELKSTTLWADLKEGFAYIKGWPGLIILLAAAMLFKIALTPAFSLLPLYVSDHFQGGAAEFSLMEAIIGVGLLLGGLILSAWGGFKRKIITTIIGMTIMGISFFILGLLPGSMFHFSLAPIFMIGFMIPFIDGPIMAILQSTIAPEKQGRILTMVGSLLSITSPLSLAIAGPVADLLGLSIWYILAGIMCTVSGIAGFFIPALLNIEENATQN